MTKRTILVLGSGGREHALVWRLQKDGHRVLSVPGNPGIAAIAQVHSLAMTDIDGLVALIGEHNIELVVIGPEAPLVAGLADALRSHGVAVFGPGSDGAKLEGSKVFAKQFFERHHIRTADFRAVSTIENADAAISDMLQANQTQLVVKADGLAAGKGVVVCRDAQQARDAARDMLHNRRFGDAGSTIIIERRIIGREISVLAITDGHRCEVLASAEDHKTIFDGDVGPNTGGMGTVCPGWISREIEQRIVAELIEPTLVGLRSEGIDYRGVLYAGVMVDEDSTPWLLEYNCRFGDPETQSILLRLEGDFASVLAGAAAGQLPAQSLDWSDGAAVCVIVAADGYPEAPVTGDTITHAHSRDGAQVFHASTAMKDGQLVSAGGRVFGVTARGDTIEQARARAYAVADAIELRGKQLRRDIGLRK
jgi:phosphoribosylamine---glycine ligase